MIQRTCIYGVAIALLVLAHPIAVPANASSTSEKSVDAAYKEILGRHATPSELEKWSKEVDSNFAGSLFVLYRTLALSDEMQKEISSRRTPDAIAFAYKRILGRTPEPSGTKFWTDKLNADLRGEFLTGIVIHEEFRKRIYVGHGLLTKSAWDKLQDGHRLELNGNCKAAIEKLKDAIKSGADVPDAYKFIAHCQQKLKTGDRGIQTLTQAIAKWKYDPELYCWRASSYIHTNDKSKALTDLNQAISLDPNYKWAHEMRQIVTILEQEKIISKELRLARQLRGEGRVEDALVQFDLANKRIPFTCAVLAERAEALMKLERYRDAMADLNVAVSTNPIATAPCHLAHAYLVRGGCHALLGDLEKAVADVDTSIKIAEHPNAIHEKARLLVRLRRYKQAVAAYDAMVAKKWKPAYAYLERAKVKILLKDSQGAIEDATKSAGVSPDLAEAYVVRAEAYKMAKKYALADKDQARARDLGSKWEN